MPREVIYRIEARAVHSVESHLEVAVVAGRAARAAHIADELALPHGLARTDRQRQAVGIDLSLIHI